MIIHSFILVPLKLPSSSENKKRKLFRTSSGSILPDVSSEQEVSTPAGRRRSSNIVEEQLRPVDIHNILNKSPSKKEVCFIILLKIWLKNLKIYNLVRVAGFGRYHHKQPFRVVLEQRCSQNMQQIYRRTQRPKCDFNFRTPFPKSISGWLLLYLECNYFSKLFMSIILYRICFLTL